MDYRPARGHQPMGPLSEANNRPDAADVAGLKSESSDEEETPRVQRRGSASDDSPAIAITSTPAGRGAVRSTHQRKDVAASLSSSSSATRQYLIL